MGSCEGEYYITALNVQNQLQPPEVGIIELIAEASHGWRSSTTGLYTPLRFKPFLRVSSKSFCICVYVVEDASDKHDYVGERTERERNFRRRLLEPGGGGGGSC